MNLPDHHAGRTGKLPATAVPRSWSHPDPAALARWQAEEEQLQELCDNIDRARRYLAALEGKIGGMLSPEPGSDHVSLTVEDRQSIASWQTEHGQHSRYLTRLQKSLAGHNRTIGELRHRALQVDPDLKPVELGVIPVWFERLLIARYGPAPAGSSMSESLRLFTLPWMANWGTSMVGAYSRALVLVAEPYSFAPDEQAIASALASRLGCRWTWTPSAWHYPGRSIRIAFLPRAQGEPRG